MDSEIDAIRQELELLRARYVVYGKAARIMCGFAIVLIPVAAITAAVLSAELPTWRHVAAELDKAAAGADVVDAAVALRIVLMLEHVECHERWYCRHFSVAGLSLATATMSTF